MHPFLITFDNGGSIEFIYNAVVIKLKRIVSGSNGFTTSDHTLNYIGGIEYRDEKIESIQHAEGRITFEENTDTGEYVPKYEYHLKDHLGNVRVTITDKDGDGYLEPFTVNPNEQTSTSDVAIDLTNTEVSQETHYYPFGMMMEGEWQNIVSYPENKYLYNGKELNKDFDLNWSDYGARWYDASIGRWNAVDPLAEKYRTISPYAYVANNPLKYIDPNGKEIWINTGWRKLRYEDGKLYNKRGKDVTKRAYRRNGKLKKSFLGKVVNGLNTIGSTKAGREVIKGLSESKFKFNIEETNGASSFKHDNINNSMYNMLKDKENPSFLAKGGLWAEGLPLDEKGGGGTILWDPNFSKEIETTDGIKSSNSIILFGHELFHGFDSKDGNLDRRYVFGNSTTGVAVEEGRAVFFGNQLRKALSSRLGTDYYRIRYDSGQPAKLVDDSGNPIPIPAPKQF